MSFMYNPYPFDDPRAVNRPVLEAKTKAAVTCGTLKAAVRLATDLAAQLAAEPQKNIVLGWEGYTTTDFSKLLNLLTQQLHLRGVEVEHYNFAQVLKSEEEINAMIDPQLEWDRAKDPTLLYGRIYHGGYKGVFDPAKLEAYKQQVADWKAPAEKGKVVIVYGAGVLVEELRSLYDSKFYFDVTPKESILRIRRGAYINLGQSKPQPTNQIIRRCYYFDFEMAVTLRGELLSKREIDWYVGNDNLDAMQLMPVEALNDILETMVKYPFRCKPVYLEGVWGGSYVKKLRNLPKEMRNCAWVFDLIPMEVSIVIEADGEKLEFPFNSFVQHNAVAMCGAESVKRFGLYFPVRFNYDDSYHSTGNMSIQCHSGAKYNKENFDELGRQDESYYVVVTGHGAKTFIGFNDDADAEQFIKDIKAADTEYKPVDYMKYVNYEESKPGLQVMLPAGTIHSSGRNQVILEIGSLTIGSYTYKLYDYLRPDLDGKPRPIHTWHGERVLDFNRRTSAIHGTIVHEPRLVRKGADWAEYIVGECEELYFSLRRLEFEKSIEDNTNGKFVVLTLVDGDKIRIRSKANPEYYFDAEFMDMTVVPAAMGEFVVENLGLEPICVHKTTLKEGFENE